MLVEEMCLDRVEGTVCLPQGRPLGSEGQRAGQQKGREEEGAAGRADGAVQRASGGRSAGSCCAARRRLSPHLPVADDASCRRDANDEGHEETGGHLNEQARG